MLWRALVVIALLLGLLVAAPTASPIQVRSMDTDTMEPAIGAGDGYVVVPAGEIRPNDIVVFWSPERGDFVVGRVLDRTEAGYVTRADASAATDHEGNRPLVPRSAIVGTVPTVGGEPLVLPSAGPLVRLADAYRIVLIGLSALAVAALIVARRRGTRSERAERPVLRVREVAGPAFVALLVTCVAITPLGAVTYQVTFVATQDGGGEYAIPVGENVTRTVAVSATDTPITRTVVRADGMRIRNRTTNGSTMEFDVSIPAFEAAGTRPASIHVFPYLAVLPVDLLGRLHDIHPIVAVTVTTGLALFPPYLLYLLFVDGSRPITVGHVRRLRRLWRD